MTNFIPIFPLSIVVYPGEELNLHIFEPRYKQLVNECYSAGKSFGIPSVINNQVSELGTLVTIIELSRMYDNGEMDIKTRGGRIFRILEEINEVPEKLYSGAIVSYPQNKENGNVLLMQRVVNGILELHKMLKVSNKFKKPEKELWSYDVAHYAGLSLQEEYELLGLFNELQREEYLKRHLTKVLPLLGEMEMLKEKVKLNGHFKNLSGLNL